MRSASYPCDLYDLETEEILEQLGIEIAFIAHMEDHSHFSPYKIPRIDVSDIDF